METEITVRIVEDEGGYFVGKAVGCPGVVAFGKTKEEVIEGIQDAFYAMAQFQTMKTIGKPKHSLHSRWENEFNVPLQYAH